MNLSATFFLFTIIVKSVIGLSASHKKCTYKNAKGNLWDLSSLYKPRGYKIISKFSKKRKLDIEYKFNVCGEIYQNCLSGRSRGNAAVEMLETYGRETNLCISIGKYKTEKHTFIKNGIRLSY